MRRSILAALLIAAATCLGASQAASAASNPGTSGVPFNAVEGNGFAGTVAHFVLSTGVPSGATIDWGDGQPTSAGTVTNPSTNTYDVAGTHAYAEEGGFPVTVTLHTSEGDVTANGGATVADAPLTITGVPVDTVRGTPLTNQRLATFTDADPGGTLTDYSATINWGDGNTTAGTVVANQGGGFAVTGSHTYADAATYGAAITIHDVGGATATAFTTVAVSLPGGNLAFASTRSGKSEIWTMRADGTAQSQLTSNSAGEFFSPSWAPDGARLAAGATVLGRQRPVALASLVLPGDVLLTVSEPGVWVLNPDGTGLSRLAVVQQPATATPAWSRDTRRIAYVDRSPAPDIFAVPTSSVQFPTMLTQTKGSSGPDWSPKGDRIAYSFKPGGLGQIWTMDPDGHHQAPLFADARSNSSPTYSPDLTRLAYVGTLPGDVSHIFIASASGLNPRMLTSTVGIDPSWSPDGTKIAFTALTSTGRGQIHVINADGTGERTLTHRGDNRHPTWRRNTCTNIRFCVGNVVACTACPTLATYSLRVPVFHVGPRPTALIARAVPTGTAFRYVLSTKARVQIAISRVRTGHRVGRRCKLGKTPRGALPCLLSTRAGLLRRRGHKGANTTAFSGRLGRRALALGHYQAAIVAIDARGRRSVPRLLDFDVV